MAYLLVLVFLGGSAHVHSEHATAADCKALAAQFNADTRKHPQKRSAVCVAWFARQPPAKGGGNG